MNDITFDLVWMQRLGGGTEVLDRGIPANQALSRLQQADREDYGAGGICFLRPSNEADPHAEIARLEAQLDDVMRAGDLEHARMAALIEACEAFALFVESYTPDSDLARLHPTFYGIFRVYGKNARAAVEAVRPQADAFLAKMAELITANTEVGQINADYLTALSAAYDALLSYAHGNSAPGLATEVAAHILATIEKVSGA